MENQNQNSPQANIGAQATPTAVMPQDPSLDQSGDLSLDPTDSQPTIAQTPVKKPSLLLRLARRADIVLAALLVMGSVGLFWSVSRSTEEAPTAGSAAGRFDITQIPLQDFAVGEGIDFSNQNVTINGSLQTNGAFVLTPSLQPTEVTPGQIYYDQTSNVLAYFNGSEFVTVASADGTVQSIGGLSGEVTLGPGLSAEGGTLSNASVLSLQGQTGAVTLTPGSGITIEGTTISNDGVVGIASGSSNIVVNTDANGNVTISSTAGGGTVSSPGGTAGTIPVFTGAQTIANSLLNQSGGTITAGGNLAVSGNLTVSGTTNLSTPLSVSSGGTGTTSLAANGVLVGQGTSPVVAVTGSEGECLLIVSGAPDFTTCPGGGGSGVTTVGAIDSQAKSADGAVISGTSIYLQTADASFPGLMSTGTQTFAGAKTFNGQITTSGGINLGNQTLQGTSAVIDFTNFDVSGAGAVTAASFAGSGAGLTSLNATNISTGTVDNARLQGGGALNVTAGTNLSGGGSVALGGSVTLHVDDSPTFAGNAVVQGGTLTVGADSQVGILALHDGGTGVAAQTGTLQVVGSLGQNTVYTLPDPGGATATICLDTGNCAGAGSGITGSGTTNTIPLFTASQNIGDSIITQSGTTIDIAGSLTLDNALGVAYGGTGLTATPTNGQLLIGDGTGYSLATLSNNGGLTITNGSGSIGLAVNYGSTAGTAVQGNTTLTCPSGTGNLTGGGNSITLGAGGTCTSLNTVANPTFATSVTTPLVQNAGLTLSATGVNDLLFQTNGNTRLTVASGGDLTATGNLTLQGGTLTAGADAQAGNVLLYDGGTGLAAHTGTLQVVSSLGQNTTYTLPDPGQATADVCLSTGNCAGAGGGITGSGTTNQLSKFTGSGTIGDSTISDDGGTVTTSVDMVIQGGDLTVGTTGQLGSLMLHDGNGQITTLEAGNSTGNLTFILPTGTGSQFQCVKKGTGNQLIWDDCEGGGGGVSGVTSLNGESGDLTLQGTTNQIAVNAAGGIITLSTPQDTHTGAAPTFAGMTLNGALNMGASDISGTNFSMQGSTGNVTSGLINGQTISSSASFTGTVTVTGNINTSGGAIQTGGTTRVDNSGNLTNIGDITSTGITLLQGGSLTVGADGQAGAFTLYDGGIGVAAHTGALQVISSLGQDTTYTLPDSGGATADICLDTGNCAGAGGGITGSGTNNTVAKFTGSGTIGDSSITDDGVTVAVGTDLNVTGNFDASGTLAAGTGNAFQVSSGAAVTAVGVNSGTGLLQGTGGLTVTGATSINTTGTANTAIGNATGTFAVTSAGLNVTTAGAVSGVTTLTASGNINTSGGALQTAGTSRIDNGGNLVNIANGTLSGDLSVNGGDITSTGALNITPGGTLTVGATGQTLTLQGSGATTLTVTDSGFTTTVGFAGTPTANVTYNFDQTASTGTYEVCTTAANCVGLGDSITGSGTTNRLAKFTGSGTIGDSSITDDGAAVTLAANVDLILQGATAYISNPQASTSGEAFGLNAAVSGSNAVAVGNAASADDSGIAIGQNAVTVGGIAIGQGTTTGAFGRPVSIGHGATAASWGVAIGESASTVANDAVAIGNGATAAQNAVAIGDSANAALNGIAIGHSAVTGGNNRIVIGAGATATADGQLIIGSSSTQISQAFIGNGVTSATPQDLTINGTGGSGTDIAGADMNIAGGRGTGSGAGGAINLQVAAAGTTGSTLNALSTIATFDASSGVTLGNTTLNTPITLQSGTGTIAIGTGAQARTVNVGTGAAAQTVTLGSSNTTSGTTIQSGSNGISLLSGANITIGTSDLTGTLLVLDTKTDAGDPTGVNGAMYYNSSTGNFRCFQSGSWIDCISASGGFVSLQNAYDNSTNPEIVLDSTRGALTLRDAVTPIGANLFEIQNNAGSATYLGVTTGAVNLGSNVDMLMQGATAYISNPQASANGEAFGLNAAVEGNAVAVGNGAAAGTGGAFGSPVAVGFQASATSWGVAVGGQASTTDQEAVAVGETATASGFGVALGSSSATGFAGIALGYNAATTGTNSSIAIGVNAATTASNQLVIGGDGNAVTQAYIGNGVTHATPQGSTLNATGGSGTNIAGAALNIAGGRGTGTGAGGNVNIQVSAAGVTGTTLNPLSTVATFAATGLTVNGNINALSTTEQLRVSYDGSNFATFTVASDGDLTISANGTQGSSIYSTDLLKLGNVSDTGNVAYNYIADSLASVSTSFASGAGNESLYIQGRLEVDGGVYPGVGAGEVLFGGTAGVIASDGSHLTYDSSNHRLAIGRNNPQSSIHVEHTDQDAAVELEAHGSASAFVVMHTGNNDRWLAGLDDTDNGDYKISFDNEAGDQIPEFGVNDYFILEQTGALFLTSIGTVPGASENVLCINGTTGQVRASATTTDCSTSSRRFKENITSLEESMGLEVVNALRPVTFNYIDGDGSTKIGLIAEEVAEILPEVVAYDDQGKPYAINYEYMVANLVKAVQQQQVQIDELHEGVLSGALIEISGHIRVGDDTAGTVIIPAGQTSAAVTFGTPYEFVPKITTGTSDFAQVIVIDKTINGFTVRIQTPHPTAIKVDWTAFEPSSAE